MPTDHARYTDPIQSDITVKSLGKDTSLKSLIYRTVELLQHPHDMTKGVTDDTITMWLENKTGRRFQRNVIARTRGLMENENLLMRVHDHIDPTTHQHRIACRTYVEPPTTLF